MIMGCLMTALAVSDGLKSQTSPTSGFPIREDPWDNRLCVGSCLSSICHFLAIWSSAGCKLGSKLASL